MLGLAFSGSEDLGGVARDIVYRWQPTALFALPCEFGRVEMPQDHPNELTQISPVVMKVMKTYVFI